MDDSDRKLISDNKERLMKTTSYNLLMEECLNYKILTVIMKENIEKVAIHESVKHKMLLEKIIHRGPTAFSRLLQICSEHFKDAYSILAENEIYSEFKSLKRPQHEHIITRTTTSLSPYDKELRKFFEVKKAKRICRSTIETYDMISKFRGVFVLVNIINNRPEAQLEAQYLMKLFTELGFIVFYHEDIKMDDLDRFIKDLCVSKYLHHCDSFVFALLANASERRGNYMVDLLDKYRDIEYFIMKFNNQNCTQLIDRPKIFMFPKYKSSANTLPQLETDGTVRMHQKVQKDENISTVSDVIYFFLEYDINRNSFLDYIRTMCDVWAENAHELHLQELIKLVNTKTFQTGQRHHRDTVDYGFTKNLYFNPGICVVNNQVMSYSIKSRDPLNIM